MTKVKPTKDLYTVISAKSVLALYNEVNFMMRYQGFIPTGGVARIYDHGIRQWVNSQALFKKIKNKGAK